MSCICSFSLALSATLCLDFFFFFGWGGCGGAGAGALNNFRHFLMRTNRFVFSFPWWQWGQTYGNGGDLVLLAFVWLPLVLSCRSNFSLCAWPTYHCSGNVSQDATTSFPLFLALPGKMVKTLWGLGRFSALFFVFIFFCYLLKQPGYSCIGCGMFLPSCPKQLRSRQFCRLPLSWLAFSGRLALLSEAGLVSVF